MWGAGGLAFDPYRWLQPNRINPELLTGGINGHFAFIEGPRICIGYRLGECAHDNETIMLDRLLYPAIFEIKVIIRAFIMNFELAATSDDIKTFYASTLQPYIEGDKAAGPQLPLLLKPLDI